MTPPTVSSGGRRVVGRPADLGLSRTGDLRGPISAERQMKCGPPGTSVRSVNRLPRGETLDRIAAACFVVLAQIELWVGNAIPGPKGLAVLFAILVPGSIAVRRRNPLAVGIAVVLTNGVWIWVSGSAGASVAIAVGWMCALYAIAVWTSPRGFASGLVALLTANVISTLGSPQVKDAVLFTAIPGVAMILVRSAVRGRELRAEALAARAELLEREREMLAHAAVADERARIARELHDLVAHNVSVMVVQAGAERHALGDERPATREALASIEQAGRQALAEARRLLGMLRRDGDGEALEPQPGIDHLDVLVEQVERAGLPVELDIDGERVPLPAGLDLCAYRVVQEGLTNALKHAGPARARVCVHFAPGALDVEVSDDGAGAPTPDGNGAGHGLIGMRERVALYGGRLTVGARDGGGFAIHAHLPIA
jgi:signal transduction histidine kinase